VAKVVVDPADHAKWILPIHFIRLAGLYHLRQQLLVERGRSAAKSPSMPTKNVSIDGSAVGSSSFGRLRPSAYCGRRIAIGGLPRVVMAERQPDSLIRPLARARKLSGCH
jgi:hypothetical protein